MATLVAEADVEKIIAGFAIADDNGRRPTTTQLTAIITEAENVIKSYLKLSTLTDTYGGLKVVELSVIRRIITNMYALTHPDRYIVEEIFLTAEEERLCRIATSNFQFSTFEIGG